MSPELMIATDKFSVDEMRACPTMRAVHWAACTMEGPSMLVSSIALIARQAYADGNVLRSTDRYVVYALPPGWLDHFVLVLPTQPQESLPEFSPSLVLPVTVDSRRGCLIVR